MKKPTKGNNRKPEPELNLTLNLKGADAQRLLDYEAREKLRGHATAGYKLMFERLDQLDAARGSVAEKA